MLETRHTIAMSAAMPPPVAGQVRVWHARTSDAWTDAARVARALDALTPPDRARYERYRRDVDREMFLLGRSMARALVGRALGVAPDRWTWQEGRHGRPEIAGGGHGLSFNLAHSAGVVVCALARGCEVGADVEHRMRPATDPLMVRRFCSPAEIADIERHGPARWRDQFLKYWTLKEAYLKARGLGIAVCLADISFTLDEAGARVAFLNSLAGTDTNWAFELTEYGASHFVAAAAPAPGGASPVFAVEPLPVDLLP